MIAPFRSEIRFLDVLASVFASRHGYPEKLAAELCDYFAVKQVLLTHSGRSALYFLLRALPQKKVYLPAYNCWAVEEAVLRAGKKPVYIDISLEDYNMDIGKLSEVLEQDSIVIATHQFGIPCDIEKILQIANERQCVVIEDNAAAFGSEIRGKKTGGFAAAGIISFENSKTVVSGKGGAILFNDRQLCDQVREIYDREVRPVSFWTSCRHLCMAVGYAYATHQAIYRLTYALFRPIRGASRLKREFDPRDDANYVYDFDHRRAKLAYRNVRRVDEIICKRTAITDSYLNDDALREEVVLPVLPDHARAVLMKLPFRPRTSDRETLYRRGLEEGVDLEYLLPYHYLNQAENGKHSHSATAAEQAMALPVYSTLRDRDLGKIKSVLSDSPCQDGALDGQAVSGHVEKRRLLCFTLNYHWLDKPAYLKSTEQVVLLRSHEQLPRCDYHLQFRYQTFLIDLSQTLEDIYSAFHAKSARYSIRKAIRDGVVVKPAETTAEKLQFFEFYQLFARHPKRKDKMLILQKSELDRLRRPCLVCRWRCIRRRRAAAVTYGRYCLYKYGATLHRCCENELLVWQAIQYAAKSTDSNTLHSWTAPTDDQNSDMHRLYLFKRKFGGEPVDFYTYVKFNGPVRALARPFDLVLKYCFDDDINTLALFLKKFKVFK